MSSQKDAGTPIKHVPDGVGYKLLELPPELLTLLESDNPPVLSLESSTNSAILKSANQSWGLRQKNTSNALILLKTVQTRQPPPSSQVPEPCLNAVSTIHDTIELVLEPTGKTAPIAKGKWHEKFARSR
ncbi:hypothetical protein F4778DRAFT_627953 [Xylariomycetidae sp. FL2044]|nr:hypothetical protein F4778DRAFT_627953 [Xylariomycetidae sp. FL2044]